jgi:hypothetical protein
VTVRLVFDETALAGYARLTTEAVGELMDMVLEEEDPVLVGIPAACFLTAYAELAEEAERDRLVSFATNIDGAAVILPLFGSDTVEVARRGTHGVIEALRHRAVLATYAGDEARKVLPEDYVLDLEE